MSEQNATPLAEVLTRRLQAEGRIPFVAYMAAALYEPGLGYYTSPGRKVGAEGDFYTSINVHAAFGRTISRELAQMWRSLECPTPFTVVEQGCGAGLLARDILDGLAELAPDCYAATCYTLVEMEPSLQAAQAQNLAAHAGRLAWLTPTELAAARDCFTGCLLSNELLDAMPVHLVEQGTDGLQEVYVALDTAGGLREELGAPSRPELAAYLQSLGVTLAAGQRAEISLAGRQWLADSAKALARGYLLTIDYGYEATEKYGLMRPNGTLLCYWRHTVEDDPLLRPGEQDITSHVDFSMLMQEGERHGLRTVWFGEQYRFLMACGILEELMALEARASSEEERLKARLALKKLLLPDGGMGDTFRVLVQAKGVAATELLCLRDWRHVL